MEGLVAETGPGPFGGDENRKKLNLAEEGTVTRHNESQAVVEWMQGAVGDDQDPFAEIARAGVQALIGGMVAAGLLVLACEMDTPTPPAADETTVTLPDPVSLQGEGTPLVMDRDGCLNERVLEPVRELLGRAARLVAGHHLNIPLHLVGSNGLGHPGLDLGSRESRRTGSTVRRSTVKDSSSGIALNTSPSRSMPTL
jgi:hypothetical protein